MGFDPNTAKPYSTGKFNPQSAKPFEPETAVLEPDEEEVKTSNQSIRNRQFDNAYNLVKNLSDEPKQESDPVKDEITAKLEKALASERIKQGRLIAEPWKDIEAQREFDRQKANSEDFRLLENLGEKTGIPGLKEAGRFADVPFRTMGESIRAGNEALSEIPENIKKGEAGKAILNAMHGVASPAIGAGMTATTYTNPFSFLFQYGPEAVSEMGETPSKILETAMAPAQKITSELGYDPQSVESKGAGIIDLIIQGGLLAKLHPKQKPGLLPPRNRATQEKQIQEKLVEQLTNETEKPKQPTATTQRSEKPTVPENRTSRLTDEEAIEALQNITKENGIRAYTDNDIASMTTKERLYYATGGREGELRTKVKNIVDILKAAKESEKPKKTPTQPAPQTPGINDVEIPNRHTNLSPTEIPGADLKEVLFTQSGEPAPGKVPEVNRIGDREKFMQRAIENKQLKAIQARADLEKPKSIVKTDYIDKLTDEQVELIENQAGKPIRDFSPKELQKLNQALKERALNKPKSLKTFTPKPQDELPAKPGPTLEQIAAQEAKIKERDLSRIHELRNKMNKSGRYAGRNADKLEAQRLSQKHGLSFEIARGTGRAVLINNETGKVEKKKAEGRYDEPHQNPVLLEDLEPDQRKLIEEVNKEVGQDIDVPMLPDAQRKKAYEDIRNDNGKEKSLRAQILLNELQDAANTGRARIVVERNAGQKPRIEEVDVESAIDKTELEARKQAEMEMNEQLKNSLIEKYGEDYEVYGKKLKDYDSEDIKESFGRIHEEIQNRTRTYGDQKLKPEPSIERQKPPIDEPQVKIDSPEIKATPAQPFKKEFIVSAAAKIGGKIFTGKTHGETLQKAIDAGEVTEKNGYYFDKDGADLYGSAWNDLFQTNEGRLLDRFGASREFGFAATEDMPKPLTPKVKEFNFVKSQQLAKEMLDEGKSIDEIISATDLDRESIEGLKALTKLKPEDEFVQQKLQEGNSEPARQQKKAIEKQRLSDLQESRQSELSNLLNRQKQLRTEINSGLQKHPEKMKAKRELADINKRIGTLKEELGKSSESMFEKQEDIFTKPEEGQIESQKDLSDRNVISKDKIYTLNEHQEIRKNIRSGNITPEEMKENFERLMSNEANIKAELRQKTLKELAPNGTGGDKKETIINRIFDNMASTYTVDNVIEYSPFSGETYLGAVRKAVSKVTAEGIKKQAEEIAKSTEEYKKSLTNPETKEEFERFIYYRGEGKLTPEQKIKWDEIKAESRREIDKRQAERESNIKKVDVGDIELNIKEGFHTKKNIPIWTVQLTGRVERDKFNDLSRSARKLGGHWSRFGPKENHGFIFESKANAEEFSRISKEDINIKDLREKQSIESKDNAVERLRELAGNIEEKANDVLNQDRQTNTVRRANMASNIEDRAMSEIEFAKKLKTIADAIAEGEAKHLSGIRQKTQLEVLDDALNTAKRNYERKNNINYTNSQKREVGIEDIAEAEYPYPFIWKSIYEDAARIVSNIPGGKLLTRRLEKIVAKGKLNDSGNARITNDIDIQTLLNFERKLKQRADSYTASRFSDGLASYKRLQAADIKNIAELRAALREYMKLKEKTPGMDEATKARIEQERIERELVGVKIPGFFPTPKPIIQDMVEMADIKPGMKVLEPSAGKGDIMDVVKENHPDAELSGIEPVSSLREVTEGKGHKLVEYDFLKHTEKYDRIVMNPPFEDGQDMTHVQHAYENLNPGGKLVSIMSSGSFSRSDKKTTAFREWIESVNGEVSDLPEGSFKSAFRPTGVQTKLVIIDKPKRIISKEDYLRAKDKFNDNLNNLSANPFANPETIASLVKMGAYHIETGARNLADFTLKMKSELGDKFDQVKDKIEELYNKSKSYWDKNYENGYHKQWISKTKETIETKMPNIASAEQIKGILKDAPQEELKWIGLDDYLKENPKISKDELLKFIEDNNVEMKEITKGNRTKNQAEMLIEHRNEIYRQFDQGEINLQERNRLLEDADSRQTTKEMELGATKFSEYQLPGGENYREMLFTLPNKTSPNLESTISDLMREYKITRKQALDGIENENYQVALTRAERTELTGKPQFVSSHFDEPNVLAHVRFNDRIIPFSGEEAAKNIESYKARVKRLKDRHDELLEISIKQKTPWSPEQDKISKELAKLAIDNPEWKSNQRKVGKKVLFLEELQSDWHQKGRKEGYVKDTKGWTAKLLSEPNAGFSKWLIQDSEGNRITEIVGGNSESAIRKAAEGIPDAPFKKDWHEVVLKRMIRYAAENGYDEIGWTTGEQQFNRWGSEEIVWKKYRSPRGNGWLVKAQEQKGGNVGGVDVENEARLRNILQHDTREINSKVGLKILIKDVLSRENNEQQIDKITDRVWERMQVEEIGTSLPRKEGLEGFYDKILPDFANKYGKKWGAEVKETTIGTHIIGEKKYGEVKQETAHSFPITSEMKNSVLYEGQPLFGSSTPITLKSALSESAKRFKETGGFSLGMSIVDMNKYPKGDLPTVEKIKYMLEPVIDFAKQEAERLYHEGKLNAFQISRNINKIITDAIVGSDELRKMTPYERRRLLIEARKAAGNFGTYQNPIQGLPGVRNTIVGMDVNSVIDEIQKEKKKTTLGKVKDSRTLDIVRRVFSEAGNRVESTPAKNIIEEMKDVKAEQGVISQTFHRMLRKSKRAGNEVTSDIRKLLDDMFEEAKRSGVKLRDENGELIDPQKVKDYIPRDLKADIKEILSDDLFAADRRIKELYREATGIEDVTILRHLFDKLGTAEVFGSRVLNLHPRTIQFITDVAKTSGISEEQAFKVVTQYIKNERYNRSSHFKRRRFEFPSQYYEKNLNKVIPGYIHSVAREIAETRKWGADRKGITEQIRDLRYSNPKDYRLVNDLWEMQSGLYEQSHPVNPSMKKAINAFINYEYTTKIGLGTASIPQLFQTAISTAVKAPWRKVVSGGIDYLTDKNFRKAIQESSGTEVDAMQMIVGAEGMGIGKNISHAAGYHFALLNRITKALAASTGRKAIEMWMKESKGNGLNAKKAQRQLKSIGINHTKPLTENDLKKGTYRFASDTQLQRDVMKEPVWMNTPYGRPLAIFKRFGYKQFNFIRREVIGELKHGNPLPLIRLAAGGALGGYLTLEAKNLLHKTLSGKDYDDKDISIWQKIVIIYAAAGALGLVGDLARSWDDQPEKIRRSILQNIEFATTPLALSEIEKGTTAALNIAGSKKPFKEFGRELLKQTPLTRMMVPPKEKQSQFIME